MDACSLSSAADEGGYRAHKNLVRPRNRIRHLFNHDVFESPAEYLLHSLILDLSIKWDQRLMHRGPSR